MYNGSFETWEIMNTGKSGLEISWSREVRGSLEFTCGSIELLHGAQRCTGFFIHHLQVPYEDAVGLTGEKSLISSPESAYIWENIGSVSSYRGVYFLGTHSTEPWPF